MAATSYAKLAQYKFLKTALSSSVNCAGCEWKKSEEDAFCPEGDV
jgi:hypothetical protein